MNEFSDKTIAQRALEVRNHGYNRAFWRLNSKRYVLLAVFFIAVTMGSFAYLPRPTAYVVLGIAIGSFARDYRWVVSSRRGWPFYVKVIDWQKVEQLAEAADDRTSG